MKLSDDNRTTLLVDIHRMIEEYSDQASSRILEGQVGDLIVYPPNGGLTDGELEALQGLTANSLLQSALRKVIANAAGGVVFDLFSAIDGVSEPYPEAGKWSGVVLVDRPEDQDEDGEFLHDEFFDTYWEWRKRRNADWKLDLYDGE